jgi:hypothetical protein
MARRGALDFCPEGAHEQAQQGRSSSLRGRWLVAPGNQRCQVQTLPIRYGTNLYTYIFLDCFIPHYIILESVGISFFLKKPRRATIQKAKAQQNRQPPPGGRDTQFERAAHPNRFPNQLPTSSAWFHGIIFCSISSSAPSDKSSSQLESYLFRGAVFRV